MSRPSRANDNTRIPCGCGCGQRIRKYDSSGRERSFVTGHNMFSPERGKAFRTVPQLNGPLPWDIVTDLFRARTGETICEGYVRMIGLAAEKKLREQLATDEVVADYLSPRLPAAKGQA